MFVHVLRAIEMSALPFKLGTQDTVHAKIDDAKFGGKLNSILGDKQADSKTLR